MMHITSCDGTPIAYATFGNPAHPPLVLLHGLGGDHRMWEPQLACYPAHNLYVIAPDVRGHGQSSPVERFTVRDCARDVVALLDHLGIAQAHIAGVSMAFGGRFLTSGRYTTPFWYHAGFPNSWMNRRRRWYTRKDYPNG
jgi:pimeloyl-ACP methyl ester carboxylesterase